MVAVLAIISAVNDSYGLSETIKHVFPNYTNVNIMFFVLFVIVVAISLLALLEMDRVFKYLFESAKARFRRKFLPSQNDSTKDNSEEDQKELPSKGCCKCKKENTEEKS